MMIKVPKKPLPSLLTVIGYPFAIALTIFSFFQVGFNIEDFKRNWENRKLVTDTLFNPKWEWAIENASQVFLVVLLLYLCLSMHLGQLIKQQLLI